MQSQNSSLQSQLASTQSSANTNTATQAVESSAPAVDNSTPSTEMVWIPATGQKYHNKPNCGNMNPDTAREVTKSEAEASGYSACKNCYR